MDTKAHDEQAPSSISRSRVNNFEEILNFAIEREQEAHDFYMELASRSENPSVKVLLAQFAAEELGHKNKLISIKKGKRKLALNGRVINLCIADYTSEVPEDEVINDYQRALLVAMHREKASFRLYSDIAKMTQDQTLRLTFLALAQEEAKHKLRFEVEYDEKILAEN